MNVGAVFFGDVVLRLRSEW